MAKKGTEIQIVGAQAPVTAPDFKDVIQSETLSMAQKRSTILEKLGLKSTKRKYATTEERKTASKSRAKERRESRTKALKQYGLEPAKRGPTRTKAQKRESRKARGKQRRGFLREMARSSPEIAKKYGIDPGRFKL